MRSVLTYYADAVMSAAARGVGCALGCSGRGECWNGTCLCEIRYAGDECDGPNWPYHAGIGGVFLIVAFVCAVQLSLCILSEYRRLKAPTFLRACKVTTQKMLYFVAFLASLIRGAYFVSPTAFEDSWTTSLLSAYYPLLLSGSSLVVCFWAEVFHLRNIRWERPRFLSKSFLAFVTFNVLNYSLLVAEVFTTIVADTSPERKNFYQHVFNGCYALLLFIVVIFFLIYGVEVFFKLRGEFVRETKICTIVSSRPGPSTLPDGEDVQETLVTKQGIVSDVTDANGCIDPRSVNQSQLQQSRVGLISQALMLILIAGFLASETLSEYWKTKVPVVSRNWHDVVFRLAEIGVAVWFPCVLWNSMAPERLWLLNPRRLFAKQLDDNKLSDLLSQHRDIKHVENEHVGSGWGECWICYEGGAREELIRPCACRGDVSAVHHACLSAWLVECASTSDVLKCKVCNTPYIVQETNRLEWERGFTCVHWRRAGGAALGMCGAAGGAWLVLRAASAPVLRVLGWGGAALVCYVCVRIMGTNTVSAYQRAKVSSLRILTDPITESLVTNRPQVSTISRTVTVDVASKNALERSLKGEVEK